MAIVKIDTLAQDHGKSSRMIRNYVDVIASVTGRDPIAKPGWVHDWAADEVAKVVALGGPKSYERQATQSQPEPAPVYEMATQSGHELASQAQPTAIAFEVVEINPGSQLAVAPVHRGPSNLIPFAPVSQLAQANLQSTQAAISAVRSMAQGVRSRLEVGSDVSWQQQQLINDELAALDLEIAELEVAGQLHRQQQLRTQAVQNLAGSEVGKRIARLEQLAAANGYQLSRQPC